MTTKTPIELFAELKSLVESMEKDCQKASPPRGMKAGGVRVRAAAQQIRDLCVELRKSVLEFRKGGVDETELSGKLQAVKKGEPIAVTEAVPMDAIPDFQESFDDMPVPDIVESARMAASTPKAETSYSGGWFKKYVA